MDADLQQLVDEAESDEQFAAQLVRGLLVPLAEALAEIEEPAKSQDHDHANHCFRQRKIALAALALVKKYAQE